MYVCARWCVWHECKCLIYVRYLCFMFMLFYLCAYLNFCACMVCMCVLYVCMLFMCALYFCNVCNVCMYACMYVCMLCRYVRLYEWYVSICVFVLCIYVGCVCMCVLCIVCACRCAYMLSTLVCILCMCVWYVMYVCAYILVYVRKSDMYVFWVSVCVRC